MQVSYTKYYLDFKQASGTSRGILHQKETFFIKIEIGNLVGLGECALFRGLSTDDKPDYEVKLQWTCDAIQKEMPYNELLKALQAYPSIQFGVEQAFLSLQNKDKTLLFPSKFTAGKANIPINGLIWMGDKAFMQSQIEQKIEAGFTTIKLKIGAIDFDKELELLATIRKHYDKSKITLRVDANGAFSSSNALEKLQALAKLDIHSIEQPIQAGQWEEMAKLCYISPIPIALDEELIGIFTLKEKENLIKEIFPHYIILKPSLIGGIQGTNEWIYLAKKHQIGWWITSALESNIGLNAIAQYTYSLGVEIPQGLGTGGLFTNNMESPLEIVQGKLHYSTNKNWKLTF
jgi:o-succinylbenzoate synthase